MDGGGPDGGGIMGGNECGALIGKAGKGNVGGGCKGIPVGV